jgi:hypothetical protein
MPNWCNNTITLKHSNPEMLVRAKNSLLEGKFLQEFIPCPQELQDTVSGWAGEENDTKRAKNLKEYGFADWYDWCCANWGTKWDVESYSAEINDGVLEASFDSAWSPPLEAYVTLEELGFEVEAMYYESGMGFCGVYADGQDDYYELGDLSSDEVKESIPQSLDEAFYISENMAEWEQENMEDE